MANKTMSPTKVVIPCRLSFANIWEPKSINGGEEKYSASLIIPKSDKATVNAIQKAVDAAGRQLHDIEVLQRQDGGLAALPDRLRETAEARLTEPGASIVELGDMLGVSKSGVNHRLRKLHVLAVAAEEAEEEKEGDHTV